jgi:hypothetical protein
MEVTAVAECDPRRGSLQESVTSTTWMLSGPGIESEPLQPAIDRLLAAEAVPVERVRKGKRSVDDVRPLILALDRDESGRRLVAELATVGRALRPTELAAAVVPGIDPLGVRVLRTHQWIDVDGEQREVLSPSNVPALSCGERG